MLSTHDFRGFQALIHYKRALVLPIELSFRLSHNYSFQKMAGAGNGSGNPYGGGVPRPTGAPAENY